MQYNISIFPIFISYFINSSSVNGQDLDLKTHPLSDNSGYFLILKLISSGKVNIWKYLFSTSTSAQCQELSVLNGYGKAQVKISDSQFFFLATDTTSPYPLHMIKVTFGATTTSWSNKLLCSSGTCSTAASESILSSDSTYVYSTFISLFYPNWIKNALNNYACNNRLVITLEVY